MYNSEVQKHIWHPCVSLENDSKTMRVEKAEGSYFYLKDGTRVLDAISSWWCKSLGHNNPRLKQALLRQAETIEHAMLANTTNDTIEGLSEKISSLTNHKLSRVFYANDGSCAVEIAIKMSLHCRFLENKKYKNKVMSLKNSYHGETVMALSVSDCNLYKKPYEGLLSNEVIFLSDIPYVNSCSDPLWEDSSNYWKETLPCLEKHKDEISCLILEPIVQGAGGMKIYSADFIEKLTLWCKQNDVHVIFDEIMTGIGRTGKMLAHHYCKNAIPDFMCLGKGLSAGYLPLSTVSTTEHIFQFLQRKKKENAFLHSHTFSGNALACSVALETLKIMEEESFIDRIQVLEQNMISLLSEMAASARNIKNTRAIGAIAAFELDTPIIDSNKFISDSINSGVLLRPLGNTIYWQPAFNISHSELLELSEKTINLISQMADKQ